MIGIVLAGGESRRFGSPKAFALYEGKYFYEYAVEALTSFCTQVVIVARDEQTDLYPESLCVLTDKPAFKGHGPLAGILTVMDVYPSDWYAVLPCDMPFVDDRIMQYLIKHRCEGKSVAMKTEFEFHPLLSLWSAETKTRIRTALTEGDRNVHPLIDQWVEGGQLLEQAPNLFDNVNRPGQLEGR